MQTTLQVKTSGDREIVIERGFQARPAQVWEALRRPELLRRWLLGPPGWTMTVCDNDMVVGGTYRYAWRQDAGAEIAMRGEYREIVHPERIVRTEVFELAPGQDAGETLATLTLEEIDGNTLMTVRILYPDAESRAGAMGSGMEAGMDASYGRLDAILDEAREPAWLILANPFLTMERSYERIPKTW